MPQDDASDPFLGHRVPGGLGRVSTTVTISDPWVPRR